MKHEIHSNDEPDWTKNTPNPLKNPDSIDEAAQVLRHFRLVFHSVKTHFQQVKKSGADKRVVRSILFPPVKVSSKNPDPFSGALPDALSQLDPVTLKRLDKDLTTLVKLPNADDKAAQTHLLNFKVPLVHLGA